MKGSIEMGSQERCKEVVIEMVKNKIDINVIVSCTGLSVDEIS